MYYPDPLCPEMLHSYCRYLLVNKLTAELKVIFYVIQTKNSTELKVGWGLTPRTFSGAPQAKIISGNFFGTIRRLLLDITIKLSS